MSGPIGLNSPGRKAIEEAVANALEIGEVVVSQGRSCLKPYKGVAAYTKGCQVVVTDQRIIVFRRYRRWNIFGGFLVNLLPLRNPHLLFAYQLDNLSLVSTGPTVGTVVRFTAEDGRGWELKGGAVVKTTRNAIEAKNAHAS